MFSNGERFRLHPFRSFRYRQNHHRTVAFKERSLFGKGYYRHHPKAEGGGKGGRRLLLFERRGVLRKIEEGYFLEWAKVYKYYYGTPREEVERITSKGKDALLIIDVQGAFQVKRKLSNAVSIFLLPPSFEELKRRLLKRGEKELKLRLEWAKSEIPCAKYFDYVVVNDVLEKAVEEIKSITVANRRKAAFVFNNENYKFLGLGGDILNTVRGGKCNAKEV